MSRLDDPITIGGITLKNRLTMAPTVKFDYADDTGFATQKHINHYRKRAEGGLGLICVEATAVRPDGRFWKNHMGLWSDEQIEGQSQIVDACHQAGVPVIIQLNHTGYVSNPELGRPVGPSTMDYRSWDRVIHTDGLDLEEIHEFQQNFTMASVRAKEAGYDGIQLHGCHGYLINQFVSPVSNLRTDEYGGTPEKSARFASEIIEAVKRQCGSSFLVSVRTTGFEAMPGTDGKPATPEAGFAWALGVAEEYVKAGCDYLQVSTGITDVGVLQAPGLLKERCPALGIKFHQHFQDRVPVSCVGGIKTADEVKYLLENDLVDTVDLGRSVLADPGFAGKVMRGESVDSCLGCKSCQFGPFAAHKCPRGSE